LGIIIRKTKDGRRKIKDCYFDFLITVFNGTITQRGKILPLEIDYFSTVLVSISKSARKIRIIYRIALYFLLLWILGNYEFLGHKKNRLAAVVLFCEPGGFEYPVVTRVINSKLWML